MDFLIKKDISIGLLCVHRSSDAEIGHSHYHTYEKLREIDCLRNIF